MTCEYFFWLNVSSFSYQRGDCLGEYLPALFCSSMIEINLPILSILANTGAICSLSCDLLICSPISASFELIKDASRFIMIDLLEFAALKVGELLSESNSLIIIERFCSSSGVALPGAANNAEVLAVVVAVK
ncbi:hypothetical protein PPL_09982 [Heterostelium album PN500]|uniref:Uncharacterized protein n=1 Tax=Heterostelium pallidum (strain ATCC 26659 / Pp 5 / PN500) TaxID=670386 RepID=D3BPT8_HETP5|nr:hypothetical protein PPL_09982 [Heterostelium album PN500]EFA76221.1 hypothetical protein PPL_09982 [Heterostelium album PN500]|eukprot:XP_020428354.1 hypothetical protein PPL_09982 [Heterostelium album PN500]